MATIILPYGTSHVRFDELADLIASALHPLGEDATVSDEFAYGGALNNLDAELKQAVKAGALAVKDPLTLGPHTFPIGAALLSSLVRVDDLIAFVSNRGIDVVVTPAKSVEAESVITPKPVQRSAAQDAAILQAIISAGYDPLSIPKNPPGKSGVKAKIRAELVGRNDLFPKTGVQFDKAWERLRAFNQIVDRA